MQLTLEDIEAGRSEAGGWTRAQLAAWGVPWPPAKGWKDRLVSGEPVCRAWRARSHTRAWTSREEFRMVEDAMARRCSAVHTSDNPDAQHWKREREFFGF